MLDIEMLLSVGSMFTIADNGHCYAPRLVAYSRS